MTIPRIASYPMPANLPASRVGWTPDPARAVLLIHDMQDYFVDFYDRSAAPIPALTAHILALRDACDRAAIPVVYSAQPAEQSLKDRALLQDWWGPGLTAQPQRAAVIEALAPRAHDTVLTKWRYSAFVRSDLLERMRAQGRDQLIICGVYAHIGCLMTAADAFMHDIQPFLVGDAVADFTPEEHAMGLSYVAGRCGVVTDTATVLGTFMRAEVATLLMMTPTDLHEDDNLLLCGLDSIRLMNLVERWRPAGPQITFAALAEAPTLRHWRTLLAAQQVGA